MFPHERSLVKRLEGKPFVLLGVNSDESRKELKAVMKKEKITWRSFWNGGRDGPISREWGIRGWPTLVIIDAKGVIRYRDVRPLGLFRPKDDEIINAIRAAQG